MPDNAILAKMLDRLFASLVRGASLNCRPHASRQRVDLAAFEAFRDRPATDVLRELLGEPQRAKLVGRVPMPEGWRPGFFGKPTVIEDRADDAPETPAEAEADPALRDWERQKALFQKCRVLSDDARTYVQETGVHALNVGYPLLSVPPGAAGGGGRVLAPIAFVPVELSVSSGAKPAIELACRGNGADRVAPNAALMAWIERQTGKDLTPAYEDEHGERPWEEIGQLIEGVAEALGLSGVDASALAGPEAEGFTIAAAPRADAAGREPTVFPSGVVGLFPMANQGLLRDTRAMIAAPGLPGTVEPFVDADAALAPPDEEDAQDEDQPVEHRTRRFDEERFIAPADPSQARTVALARTSTGLVVHGPPGTGKSQTITNIIGDCLSRDQRVLFVCDKRTALDVVHHRLEHLGLGRLCALVHDPQRDQRDLYMSIRANLEQLAECKTHPRAEQGLEKIDDELQRLHDQLTAHHDALMRPDADGRSLHTLIGQWFAIDAPAPEAPGLDAVTLDQLDQHRDGLHVLLQRGQAIGHATNPWTRCAGLTLEAFLSRPVDEMRRGLASCLEDARVADTTRHDAIPPFHPTRPLAEQARQRLELADLLQTALDTAPPDVAKQCAALSGDEARRELARLDEAQPYLDQLDAGPLDRELWLTVKPDPPLPGAIAPQLGALDAYLAIASTWHAFLHFGAKSRAAKVCQAYGLTRDPQQADRLRAFLRGLRARWVLADLYDQLTEPDERGKLPDDDVLRDTLTQHRAALRPLVAAQDDEELDKRCRTALQDDREAPPLIDGLRRSEPRAAALEQLEQIMTRVDLFDARWLPNAFAHLREGRKAVDGLQKLSDRFDTLEDVLRIRDGLNQLPAALSDAAGQLLEQSADPELGRDAIFKALLAGEIARRLDAWPDLKRLDAQQLAHAFERCRQLEDDKRRLTVDAILHRWIARQQQALLVSTGSRLNAEGARLRNRLFTRGKRAMRLRQVIHIGQELETQDPLFDMCPVWMASPETVAQVFPREAMFDVVVFDEASQCRLEEALPVLTRAKRVVIAGDPKQLPPSRFFEAAVTVSDDEEIQTEQDLFEMQQGEVEDLLSAALNLEIEESYLDVHYRSRNADLIGFSNEHFYRQRLQAIPGHPRNIARFPPITLHRADGVYEDRANVIEARAVCEIVRDLLKRADPPSIGVACFNLVQRDLIAEMLDELALADSAFARRLAAARTRTGEDSFEGLFVKNLENVQGDERDHIIISTTYGPTPGGKFYRRFGPLGRAGGGRRLNVLVTRARHEVHLVTSIPREAYHGLPPVPDGAAPNGGYLLFQYLRYAEQLAERYEQLHGQDEQDGADALPSVNIRPADPMDELPIALARRLAADHGASSDVFWGNEGFCVDAALHHPVRPDDVSLGLLTDFARFPKARDPVEWDLFAAGILRGQGWDLHRVWSPHLFRDAAGQIDAIDKAVKRSTDAASGPLS